MIQMPGASGVMNGGKHETLNVAAAAAAAAADTAAIGARSIDFTLDGKEGLFQVP